MAWGSSPIPTWMQYQPATYSYFGTAPVVAMNVTYNLMVYGYDTRGAFTGYPITLTITPNNPPVDNNKNYKLDYYVYSQSYFEIQFPKDAMKDPEGNTIIYTASFKSGSSYTSTLPSWTTWHTYNRTLNGWPPTNNGTIYKFALVGNDNNGGTRNVTYNLHVSNLDAPAAGIAIMALMGSASIIGCLIFVIHVCTIYISKKEMAEMGLDRQDFIKTMSNKF